MIGDRTKSSSPGGSFDYGAALRVPAAHDRRNRAKLCAWLGDNGRLSAQIGSFLVLAPEGWVLAQPGDWIILSIGNRYHVVALPCPQHHEVLMALSDQIRARHDRPC